ncbi:MAG: beta-hydroxyacyl-ACP dehydratase [Phycisphaerales bacterium]
MNSIAERPMRWMWIDKVVEYEPGTRLVAVKNCSLAEEHLHDHFAADEHGPSDPVMPASLLLEGMAQTAGILVGSLSRFREKVVLAKIVSASIDDEVRPGQCVRYSATVDRADAAGAAAGGIIERWDHAAPGWTPLGRVEFVFSHLDQNRSGQRFPEENFVFAENFRTILHGTELATWD